MKQFAAVALAALLCAAPAMTLARELDPAVTSSPPVIATAALAEEQIHVVEPGDTLNRIAARYGITTEALIQANGFNDRNRILRIGERLVIPPTSQNSAPSAVQRDGMNSIGVVVFEEIGCDYFIVQAAGGYALLEWYGGAIPMRGDNVAGAFEMFGMPVIFNQTQGTSMTVWVEDYGMSRTGVSRSYRDQCPR